MNCDGTKACPSAFAVPNGRTASAAARSAVPASAAAGSAVTGSAAVGTVAVGSAPGRQTGLVRLFAGWIVGNVRYVLGPF